ncbi:Rid family detoxifying hydrolase [Xylophilus sp. GW821-FHT01B05]
MMKTIITTEQAPKALGAYSQGVVTGDFVYTSGQIGIAPQSMKLVEGVEAQIRQTLTNLKAIVEAGGGSLADVIKLSVFLIEKDSWALVNKVMGEFFTAPFPARTALGVAWLPLGAEVEIEAIVRLASNA